MACSRSAGRLRPQGDAVAPAQALLHGAPASAVAARRSRPAPSLVGVAPRPGGEALRVGGRHAGASATAVPGSTTAIQLSWVDGPSDHLAGW